MPTPSLLIVPARFKSGKLYSQLPTSGAGDFTVTRATNATRVNASGLIESVASGIPRLDYFASGGTVGCPALLVEPSGTNTLSGSVSLDTGWTLSSVSTTSGIVSPSGSNDATLFEASVNTTRVRQTATLASGSTYTFSCFGKFGALSSGFTLNVFDENSISYGSGVCQAFNLNEGTLGASGTIGAGFTLQSVGMENYGSGWYRCRMTVLMGYTPTTPRVGFRIGTQISTGRPLSVVSGTVNAWGAQLETGSVATSYIPTTTGSVTRNADVFAVSGTASGIIGQTQGTIYAEVDVTNQSAVRTILTISDNSSTNRIRLRRTGATSCDIERNVSGSSNASMNITIPSSGIVKIAIGYSSAASGFIAYVNGSQAAIIAAATNTFSGQLIQINLGANFDGSAQLNDRILDAALYPTRLSNAELAALTSL